MHKIRLVDLLENEEFQIKNALPTAEGAVEIAMHELPITLSQTRALILGYGRIGKVLFPMLKTLCKSVSIAARKPSDIAYIEILGGESVDFCGGKFVQKLSEFDVIFNTVPARILDENALEKLKKNCLVIDLASGKGGVDFAFAERKKIKAIHALALPGKVAPVTAGNIICDLVLELLHKKGEA